MRALGTRFLIVGLLALLMFIPLFFVSAVIDDRSNFSRQTIRDVGAEWGGAQLLSGPTLILPVEGPVTVTEQVNITDPDTGEVRQETRQRTEIRRQASIFLLPEQFDLTLDASSQIRSRGIFNVPVYAVEAAAAFDFDTDAAPGLLQDQEQILWHEAQLRLTVSENRALRGQTALSVGEQDIPLEPRADGTAGIVAALGDPRDHGVYRLNMGFNGASDLRATPMGRTSTVTMRSDWPHPSFFGAFLPDSSEISDTGFNATWTIPHLARPLPQASRADFDQTARQSAAFGVRFFEPNDFYQKAFRAARYGILFIALTFLTVLLIEGRSGRPTHPVQYILIGLAQSVFVLLMVSYAEQIGFGPAYGVSAAATTVLLTMFGGLGLKLGKRTAVLGLMLAITYAVLYLILRSADYALLAGSTLAFVALALTMYMTRNEDWYGPPRDGPRKPWFGAAKPAGGGDASGAARATPFGGTPVPASSDAPATPTLPEGRPPATEPGS